MLVRNSAVEQELNRKSQPRYLGPYKVARRTAGGAYILEELSGEPWRKGIAAFRLIPYIARTDPRLQWLAPSLDTVNSSEHAEPITASDEMKSESEKESDEETDSSNDE